MSASTGPGTSEWDRTIFIYASDHGYNLGQFRVDSDKTQVYDHVTRVPLLIKGPGILGSGSSAMREVAIVASMADIAPTLLELAVGNAAAVAPDYLIDGESWAPVLNSSAGSAAETAAVADFGRTATLIEYQPGRRQPACSKVKLTPPPRAAPPTVYNISCHYHDGPNNTFSALRIISPRLGNLMYAEFVDGTDPKVTMILLLLLLLLLPLPILLVLTFLLQGYDFDPSAINFRELYNVSEDYYMLTNIYSTANTALKSMLHSRLQKAIACKGSAAQGGECTAALTIL